MANTKKVATKKVVAPAKGGKKEKLTLASVILGYIAFAFMAASIYCGIILYNKVGMVNSSENYTKILTIVMLVAQVVVLAEGALLIAKSVKIDGAYGKEQKKFNLAFGIVLLATLVLLIGAIVLHDIYVEIAYPLSITWSSLTTCCCLAVAVTNTIWLAQRNK